MPGAEPVSRLGRRGSEWHASRHDLRAAISRLDALLSAGLPVGDAIAVGASAGGSAARLLVRVSRTMARGRGLAASLRQAVPRLLDADIALVEAGERCGDLAGAVAQLRLRLDDHAATRTRLAQASAYPVALAVMTFAVLVTMSVWVLPSFAAIYEGSSAELPAITRAVIALGAAVVDYGATGAATATSSFAVLAALRRSTRGRMLVDRALVASPVVGRLVRADERSRVYATLSSLLGAGVDLDEALGLSASAAVNREVRGALVRARSSVQRGLPLSTALARSGLDVAGRDAAVVRVAEATGDYAGCLGRLAVGARVERDELLSRIFRFVEPATVTFMAIVVGATVLAVYQPVLGSAALLAGGSR